MNGSFHRLQWRFCSILALVVSISALAEPLPFRRAMELVAQRGYRLALGHEDLNDHDQLGHASWLC